MLSPTRSVPVLLSALVAAVLIIEPAARAEQGANAAPQSRPAKAEPKNEDCLQCHSEGVGKRGPVRAEDLAAGPHTAASGVSCVSCHTRAAAVPDISEHGRLGPASCDGCHDASKAVRASVHGRSPSGRPLPTCASCHGSHDLRRVKDAASRVAAGRQPKTCGACHEGPVLANYQQSVHGRRLAAGAGAPTCATCHGSHAIGPADLSHNGPFKQQLTETCGKCHAKEFGEYRPSIHGQALLVRGRFDSASCADCHKSHEILPPTDPNSAVHKTAIVRDCSRCHADARLIRRSQLPSQVVASYQLSYHGRASQLGSTAVANCASCHENHAIFPSADPRSSVNRENLPRSCGKCHPGATGSFIQGKIHVVEERQANYPAWLVKVSYIGLIMLIIGGMVVHNLLDFIRKTIIRVRRQRSQPSVVRMNGLEKATHILTASTFLVLVYTGFALLFPHAWWVAPLNWISETERFRRWVHRGAGVLLTLLALQHLAFLLFTTRGREQRRHFLPRLLDLRQFGQNLLFYLGRRAQRPAFGRFSYMEKAEYWALIWGTAVMVITGLVLWFQTLALSFMPRWLWEVFQVVHRFEAILAGLAILVWHFYFVFVNPDEAPMALTWMTGRMTLHELSLQHGSEFAELSHAGALPAEPEYEATRREPAAASGGAPVLSGGDGQRAEPSSTARQAGQ